MSAAASRPNGLALLILPSALPVRPVLLPADRADGHDQPAHRQSGGGSQMSISRPRNYRRILDDTYYFEVIWTTIRIGSAHPARKPRPC